MSETRKLAAILVADIVGYSRLAGADEDRILARLRTLRSDLIDPQSPPIISASSSPTGDGSINRDGRGRRAVQARRVGSDSVRAEPTVSLLDLNLPHWCSTRDWDWLGVG